MEMFVLQRTSGRRAAAFAVVEKIESVYGEVAAVCCEIFKYFTRLPVAVKGDQLFFAFSKNPHKQIIVFIPTVRANKQTFLTHEPIFSVPLAPYPDPSKQFFKFFCNLQNLFDQIKLKTLGNFEHKKSFLSFAAWKIKHPK